MTRPAPGPFVAVAVAAAVLVGCSSTASSPGTVSTGTRPGTVTTMQGSAGVTPLRVEVVAVHPHDTSSYTQGLEFAPDGTLYESGGRYGSSTVREVDPQTGEVLRVADLPAEVFGEGLTLVDDELVQLTWREGRALRWDAATFDPLGEIAYMGEGWGLCDDGERLVMSDGSAALTMRDRDDFSVLDTVGVTAAGAAVPRLNELECVGGTVWANIYQTDTIVQIDPATGEVLAQVDAAGLLSPAEAAEADVLNGIAKVPGDGDTFLITGKNWPWTFEVRFVPA